MCGVAEQLLAAGARPDLVNKDNKTAVDLAMQNPEKMEAVVQLLAKHSLLAAAQAGSAELVAEHLEHHNPDADPTSPQPLPADSPHRPDSCGAKPRTRSATFNVKWNRSSSASNRP